MGSGGMNAMSGWRKRLSGRTRVRGAVSTVAVLMLASTGLAVASATTAGALGPNAIRAGFNSTVFPGNDDGSTTVALPFPVHFFTGTYNQLFLNNNGNVTFDAALGDFTPFDLSTAGRVIIAPFFADIDTRVGNPAAYGSGTVDGHAAWGATWPGVGCYRENDSVLNDFQVILIDRSDVAAGDFDIEFNYDQIQWETGTASGGDADCLGGSSARAGYSDGTSTNTIELPGSAVNGAFLDSNLSSGLVHNSLNNAQDGRYVFPVRSGQPPKNTTLTTSLSGGGQSGTSISVPEGTGVTDSAVLAGDNAATASGIVTYTVFSDAACTNPVASGGDQTVAAGSVPDSDPVTLSAPGTYYWQAAYGGDSANAPSSSACGDEVETVTGASLVTSIVGAPEPVTAGQDVQYTVTVQNNSATAVPGVQVVDTLPDTTTFVAASAPDGCTGTGPVTCSLDTIGPNSSAAATITVQTASGSGGTTVTDSATTSPGFGSVSFDTHIVAPTPGSVSGFVPPAGTLNTHGKNPALLSLPDTGPGATVEMNQVKSGNTFCGGPCHGPATFISDFPGYPDPNQPIKLLLKFEDHSRLQAEQDYQNSTIWKVRDGETVGAPVPDCQDDPTWTAHQKKLAAQRRAVRIGTHSGIANPAPCVDGRSIFKVSSTDFIVTFAVLFTSDDGGWSRR